MSKIETEPQPQPSLTEAIRRGWDWVVYIVKTLARVGGIGAWIRTFQRLFAVLMSRFKVQQQYQARQINQSPQLNAVERRRSFYDASDFEFAALLEANWQQIRDELEQLHGQHFIPWSERYLYQDGWSTFGLYAYGVKIEKNCKLCPETTKLIEQIPNLMTAGFSALAPGTHIAPHTGYPDGVLRCHLGLMVPDLCGIRIGDETQSWREGKCLIFDDTIEHEAWNNGDRIRVVLLLDFKAPEGLLPN